MQYISASHFTWFSSRKLAHESTLECMVWKWKRDIVKDLFHSFLAFLHSSELSMVGIGFISSFSPKTNHGKHLEAPQLFSSCPEARKVWPIIQVCRLIFDRDWDVQKIVAFLQTKRRYRFGWSLSWSDVKYEGRICLYGKQVCRRNIWVLTMFRWWYGFSKFRTLQFQICFVFCFAGQI